MLFPAHILTQNGSDFHPNFDIFPQNAARRKKRRIRERTLFVLCFLGGSPAMYLTMLAIRHKTKHKSFMIGIPLIMLLQITIIYCIAIDIVGIK